MSNCDMCRAPAEFTLIATAGGERASYVVCGLHARRLEAFLDRPPAVEVVGIFPLPVTAC